MKINLYIRCYIFVIVFVIIMLYKNIIQTSKCMCVTFHDILVLACVEPKVGHVRNKLRPRINSEDAGMKKKMTPVMHQLQLKALMQ